jgi:hypothetical protein
MVRARKPTVDVQIPLAIEMSPHASAYVERALELLRRVQTLSTMPMDERVQLSRDIELFLNPENSETFRYGTVADAEAEAAAREPSPERTTGDGAN